MSRERLASNIFWFLFYNVVDFLYVVQSTLTFWKRHPFHPPPVDLKGKVCVVTGANSGVGKEVALYFADQGCHVVLGCRNIAAGRTVAAEIQNITANNNVEASPLDLCSFHSVKQFCSWFKNKGLRLDYLINNAGQIVFEDKKTEDNFEAMYQGNHLGPLFLTLSLVFMAKDTDFRIVNVSSIAHYLAPSAHMCGGFQGFVPAVSAYGHSKLVQLMCSKELHRRLKARGSSCSAVAVHPGLVRSSFYHRVPLWFMFFLRPLSLLFKSCHLASHAVLFAALSPEHVVGGQYTSNLSVCAPSAEVADAAVCSRVLDASLDAIRP